MCGGNGWMQARGQGFAAKANVGYNGDEEDDNRQTGKKSSVDLRPAPSAGSSPSGGDGQSGGAPRPPVPPLLTTIPLLAIIAYTHLHPF